MEQQNTTVRICLREFPTTHSVIIIVIKQQVNKQGTETRINSPLCANQAKRITDPLGEFVQVHFDNNW